jgi:hypothetical protein
VHKTSSQLSAFSSQLEPELRRKQDFFPARTWAAEKKMLTLGAEEILVIVIPSRS